MPRKDAAKKAICCHCGARCQPGTRWCRRCFDKFVRKIGEGEVGK